MMEHDNVSADSRHGLPTQRPEELLGSVNDYVRLRELVGDNALAEELERAIVVPADRIPKNVVTMNSRLTIMVVAATPEDERDFGVEGSR